eukprot:10964.XXX_314233_311586_1 [CDS] Oithona nana genome sequencing.
MPKQYILRLILGKATTNSFSHGKVLEKSSFAHLKNRPQILEKTLAQVRSAHQRDAFKQAGVNIQSQEAYELAVKGLVKPTSEREGYTIVYGLECVDFDLPYVKLKVTCINESPIYLAELCAELGLKLRTNAVLDRLHLLRYGPFTSENSLLLKHLNLQNILYNINDNQPNLDLLLGVATISDRCSSGQAEDKSGPKLVDFIREALGSDWIVTQRSIIPDEKDQIKDLLTDWSDVKGLNLIVTTGGTGFAPRDVTPEATKEVIERETPGLVQTMMSGSLKVTPMAMLSRLTSGIRGKTLIVNLPGNTKGAVENFSFITKALKHGIDVLSDNKGNVEAHHAKLSGGVGTHVCPHHQVKEGGNSDVASRPRQSPYPMITVEEAQRIILSHSNVLANEEINQDQSLEKVVIGASNAGNAPQQQQGVLSKGQCMRINTGAPIPEGADAVVQVEDTELLKKSDDGKEELEIKIKQIPKAGQDIRPIGSDIEQGSVILHQGSVIGPAEIGLLATVGATKIKVVTKPIISLLSTGNELQDPKDASPLKSGFIRDSNKSTLKALLDDQGFSVNDCGIATDDLEDLNDKLSQALQSGDIVVTTGGVSMGDRDLLRQVLVQKFDATIHFGRVNMKPGKPTTFATLTWSSKKKLVLGLPGNPVSATVTSHLYVLPCARAMSGYDRPFGAIVKAKIPMDLNLDSRPEYYRVVLTWSMDSPIANVQSTGNQISSRLASLKAANGLLMLPPRSQEKSKVSKDEVFQAMVIGPLFR